MSPYQELQRENRGMGSPKIAVVVSQSCGLSLNSSGLTCSPSIKALLMAIVAITWSGSYGAPHAFASESRVCIRNCGVELVRCIERVRVRMRHCAESLEHYCDDFPEEQSSSCTKQLSITCEAKYASDNFDECISDHRSCVTRCK